MTGRQICCVVSSDMNDNIIRFSFQDRLDIIFHVFGSSTSKKPYFYIVFICDEKFSYSQHYWVIYNGNSLFRPFYLSDFTIDLAKIDTFVYLFLCDRLIWSVCSSYILRFKKLLYFFFRISGNFPIVLLAFHCKLPFH